MNNPFILALWWPLTFITFFASLCALVIVPEEKSLFFSGMGLWSCLMAAMITSRWKSFKMAYSNGSIQRKLKIGLLWFSGISLLVLGQYIFYSRPKQIDLHQHGLHTLTEQTKFVLNSLKEDERLEFIIFSRPNELQKIKEILEIYRVSSDNKITYSWMDPDRSPLLIKGLQIEHFPSVIVKKEKSPLERHEIRQVKTLDELGFTNALMSIRLNKQIKVGWVQGHGELNSSSVEQSDGGGMLKFNLEKRDILVEEVHLDQWTDEEILNKLNPENYPVLLLLSPQNLPRSSVFVGLQKYIHEGGKIFFTLAPRFDLATTRFADRSQSKNDLSFIQTWDQLLKPWGLEFANGLVIDQKHNVQGSLGTVPLAHYQYVMTDIKKNQHDHNDLSDGHQKSLTPMEDFLVSKKQLAYFFPMARPYFYSENSSSRWVNLLQTSKDKSFVETSWDQVFRQDTIADYSEGDWPGPINLLSSYIGKNEQIQIIVAGTSQMFENQYANYSPHLELLDASLQVLASHSSPILSLHATAIEEASLIVTQYEKIFLYVIGLGVIPGFCGVMILGIYFKQKKLLEFSV